MRALIIVTILICGCAHVERVNLKSIAGSYSNGDRFCPRTLDLRTDSSFTYDQLTDNLVSGKDGIMVFEGSWGVRGRWNFIPPDRIEMLPEGNSARIEIFIRTYSNGKVALLEPSLYPDILKAWTPQESVYFLRKTEPNKSPEPTSGIVTSPAEPGAAPIPPVAHL
jgi:hypothetical protein